MLMMALERTNLAVLCRLLQWSERTRKKKKASTTAATRVSWSEDKGKSKRSVRKKF